MKSLSLSYVPLAEDAHLAPGMRWWWFPKGNPFKGFVILTLPTAKIPILKSRPVMERDVKLTGVYRIIWPKEPLRIVGNAG